MKWTRARSDRALRLSAVRECLVRGKRLRALAGRRAKSLIVGQGEIAVTVLGVQGNQVRFGVNAPRQGRVHREEIQRRILNEKDPEPSL